MVGVWRINIYIQISHTIRVDCFETPTTKNSFGGIFICLNATLDFFIGINKYLYCLTFLMFMGKILSSLRLGLGHAKPTSFGAKASLK